MDKALFYISLFLLFIGIGGQLAWYYFGHIPCVPRGSQPNLFATPCDPSSTVASFQEMEYVSGYAMIFGLILLPAGLFKDGLPAPGPGAKIFIGVALIVLVAVGFTAILITPSASAGGPKLTPGSFITIIPGASNPSQSLSFSPPIVTVIIGTNNTIQWTNNDNTLHTVTLSSAPSGVALSSLNSNIAPGATVIYQFTVPGTYHYFCEIHPYMKGTIIVKQ